MKQNQKSLIPLTNITYASDTWTHINKFLRVTLYKPVCITFVCNTIRINSRLILLTIKVMYIHFTLTLSSFNKPPAEALHDNTCHLLGASSESTTMHCFISRTIGVLFGNAQVDYRQ